MHPEQRRRENLKKKGVSPEWVNEQMERQNGKCACCFTILDKSARGQKRVFITRMRMAMSDIFLSFLQYSRGHVKRRSAPGNCGIHDERRIIYQNNPSSLQYFYQPLAFRRRDPLADFKTI